MSQLAMPIPAEPEGEGTTSTVLALFGQLHEQLRDETKGLGVEAINWVPSTGANSIATIVTHLVGSEAETLRALAGLAVERDREAEFDRRELNMTQVLILLDQADDLIREVTPRISLQRLEARFPLPTLPVTEVRSGLTWMVGNYGHAREHLGHIQLTRQLFQAKSGQSPTPE
jgi:DinB superfamily